MTLPEKYAHDYRDMAMSEEELRKMLEEFADEIRKERVTHCDDINCPECPKVAYQAGVKAERARIVDMVEVAKRNIIPKHLEHIPLSDYEWMKGKSKVECVNEVYQWVIDYFTSQGDDNK